MNMQYVKSVEDFFKSPKWGMNILLGGVCMMIPLIGQLVLTGWNITQFWAQGLKDDPASEQPLGDPTTLPEFDFNHFTKYLSRGLWPFLAQLIVGLAIGIVLVVVIVIVMIVFAILAKAVGEAAALAFPVFFLIGMILYLAICIAINLILVPITLKATLAQELGPAFDLGFVKSFLSSLWKEIILSALFFFGLAICMVIIAIPTFGLGVYFAIPIMTFAWQHMLKQMYLIYLERGGIAVDKSEKLNDLPPALPAAE